MLKYSTTFCGLIQYLLPGSLLLCLVEVTLTAVGRRSIFITIM